MKLFKNLDNQQIGDWSFNNFVHLTESELVQVLNWRNADVVRRWMVSSAEISLNDHLKFVNSLYGQNMKGYWVASKKGNPIGVVNLIWCPEMSEYSWGMYLIPDRLSSGLGLEMEYYFLKMCFEYFELESLVCEIFVENIDSIRIQKFFGFYVIQENPLKMRIEKKKYEYLGIDFKSLKRKLVEMGNK